MEVAFNILIGLIYLAFWGVAFLILYHLTRFGVGVQPKRLAAAFFLGAIILFGTSLILFANLDLSPLKLWLQ
ncbi:hypothetical protein KW807_02345 [Candidatus Parcubacteria bacterium]|nr:hypothetical protein [Candidatus Parcubacteria bacterium]